MTQQVIDFYAAQLYRDIRRVIVCGSRSFRREHIGLIQLELGSMHRDTVIVHGGQGVYTSHWVDGQVVRRLWSGADMFADEVAADLGMCREVHQAAWRELGKRAGFVRNRKMVSLGADFTLAFWDGESNGTRNTLELSRAASIPCRVVTFQP